MIFGGVFLRIFQFNQVPMTLYWDEVAMYVDAKVVAESGKDMHGNSFFQPIFLSYGDYKMPVYTWISSLFAIFIDSDLVVRLPNLAAGLVSFVILADLSLRLFADTSLMRQIKSRRWQSKEMLLALATMLVLAVSPWPVMFSRTGFEGHLGQFFLTLSIWLLVLYKKRSWLFWLVPLLGLIATYSYFSVRYVWPVVVIAGYALVYSKSEIKLRSSKKDTLKSLAKLILILSVFFVGLIPMLRSSMYPASQQFRLSTPSVLDITHPVNLSNQYRDLASDSLFSRLVYHRYYFISKSFLSNLFDHLNLSFLFVTGESNLRHSTGKHGLFLVTLMPMLLIGLYGLTIRYKKILLFLIIWWLAALVPASMPHETPHALRSLNALTPLVLIIGFGLYWSLIKTSKYKMLQLGYICLVFLNTLGFGHYYFTVYPQVAKEAWQYSYKELTDEIISQRIGKEPVVVRPIEGRHYLWFLAYGNYSAAEIHQMRSVMWDDHDIGNLVFDQELEVNYLFPKRL